MALLRSVWTNGSTSRRFHFPRRSRSETLHAPCRTSARTGSTTSISRFSRILTSRSGSGFSSGPRSSTCLTVCASAIRARRWARRSSALSAASLTTPGSSSSLCACSSEPMRVALLVALAGALLLGSRPAGLDFVHRNSPTAQKYLIETMGGGVALLDYNNDGLLDIFLVNGGKLADPQKLPADFGRRDPAYWNRLYRQDPGGGFTDVTAAAGLSSAVNHYGMGVATGDYNNDGYTDLYVTGYGRNVLYRNNGNGTFTDVTEEAGVAGSGWSVSAAFLDYDNDGRLDLFVSRYLDYDIGRNMLCGEPLHTYCRPDPFEGTTKLPFPNEGNRQFPPVAPPSRIASADYDNDGLPDLIITNLALEKWAVYRNDGGGRFSYATMATGMAALTARTSGWGVGLYDFDNDGWKDVFAARSHVLDNVERV